MIKIKVKIGVIVFCMINLVDVSIGQIKDTNTITSLNWIKKEIAPGVTWEHLHSRDSVIFNSRQNINLIRFSKNAKNVNLEVGRSNPEGSTLTSELVKQSNGIAGINASFFNVKTGQSVNLIKQHGEIKDTTSTNHAKYSSHQMGVFAFAESNAEILMRDTSQGKYWDTTITWANAIESGPLLLLSGTRMDLANNAFNSNRHPRTCACITKNEILLLTADGRSSEAYGLSLFELTEFLESLGCIDAINFDGGGSTTMYIKGGSNSGVVNMPCDNKVFDHDGERKVSNVLLIKVKTD